jgi:Glycosyltransferase (GlcNAc)
MRAWTHGWDIYAPRKNLIAHQYRPGRMWLPKFWGSVNRLYKGTGNNAIQAIVIPRIKHMVGYPDSSLDKINAQGINFVLKDIEHYGLGSVRSWEEYMEFAHMSIDKEHDVIVCSRNEWCNQGLKD